MARPKLGDSESKRLQMVITEDELEAVDTWQHANRVASRSEAIRRLIQIGIELERWAGSMDETLTYTIQSQERLANLFRESETAPDHESERIIDETKDAMDSVGAGLTVLSIDSTFVASFVKAMKGGKSVQEAIATARQEQDTIEAGLQKLFNRDNSQ